MPTKMLFIHGSPRENGNTAIVSKTAIRAAQEMGAEVSEQDATRLTYKVPGCRGCLQCHRSEQFACVLDDQIAESVSSLSRFDVIVLATPTYWMSYPAQLKMLIDRMGALMKFTAAGDIQTPLAGKTLAILATGSGPLENNLALLEQQWRNVAHMLSCRFSACLFPQTPTEAGALRTDSAALTKAQAFGHRLAASGP